MKEALKILHQMNFRDTPNATSLQVSAYGAMLSGKPVGPMTAKSGPDLVLANLSAGKVARIW